MPSPRLQLAVVPACAAFAGLTLALAQAHPDYSFAGQSPGRLMASLAAGSALLATGLAVARRRPDSRSGPLLVAASFAWFALEWNNPGGDSAVGFTIGLALYATAPPLIAHAALAYPAIRPSRVEHAALVAAYLGAVVALGVLPALVFDPSGAGCADCPRNGLLVHSSTDLAARVYRLGVELGLAWSVALVVVIVLRVVRAAPALRRIAGPVLACAAAYLMLVAADFAHSLDRGTLGNDDTDRALWLAQAGAIAALCAAVAWGWIRDRRTRAAVATLVVEMSRQPGSGGLRALLARTLRDPSLALAYPLAGGGLVDAEGRPARLQGELTPLVRGGREVAVLSHRPGLLEDRALVQDLTAAAQLALENERLQAIARAQVDDLRVSRARVIATGEAERQRLERNLHDGAQQRIVALSLALRLTRSRMRDEADDASLHAIAEAEREVGAALDDLRALAHGLFPAVLPEEGLAAALVALAEESVLPVRLTGRPQRRLPAEIEAAAYFVAAHVARNATATHVAIGAWDRASSLVVEVACDGDPGDVLELEDRVGALDGRLHVAGDASGTVTVRAEIPCAS